ncbi:hypothetical protein [Sphingomonas hankookensis]|uniref:hypothetical protein n=1 Tax=Sphingomonas hankookensis TaxID=563996 RepID=UPI003D3038AD
MSIDTPEAVARFAGAVANLSADLLAAGVQPEALAAGLRIEAGKVERHVPPVSGRQPDERELTELARKAHEFINTIQIAGIEEQTAVVVISHVLVERVARTRGAAGAAHWLRGLARLVDANGDVIETTSKAH